MAGGWHCQSASKLARGGRTAFTALLYGGLVTLYPCAVETETRLEALGPRVGAWTTLNFSVPKITKRHNSRHINTTRATRQTRATTKRPLYDILYDTFKLRLRCVLVHPGQLAPLRDSLATPTRLRSDGLRPLLSRALSAPATVPLEYPWPTLGRPPPPNQA